MTNSLKESDRFLVTEHFSAINTQQFRDAQLDAVLMPPLDYARESSQMKLVPGVAITSDGTNDVIMLHFKEGLHDLRTIAADPSYSSEIVLSRIILAEEFGQSPTIIPIADSLETMLNKADCALLVGDSAFRSASSHRNRINLVEAWNEMTRLPYVHAVWAGRKGSLTESDVELLQRPKTIAGEEIRKIASESFLERELLEEQLYSFQFDFSDSAENALIEYFRYAYFHGVLQDIPDLSYFFSGTDNDKPGDMPTN